MSRSSITRIAARQILDSRGRPTIEVDVVLEGGASGRASTPSGASKGRHEAWELRDGDVKAHRGLGVLKAVANVHDLIAPHLLGGDASDQQRIDDAMRTLDPSPRLSTIGANAVLATSLAISRAAANAAGIPLYAYIHQLVGTRPMTMPMPMTNILSGGAHAGRSMDVQDFLVMPVGASTYAEALDMISEVRASAAVLMADAGLSTLLADEGGLSPGYRSMREALDLMVRSFEDAGLRPGEDAAIAIDVAASELMRRDGYALPGAGLTLSGDEMIGLLEDLVGRYPIVSIEDPLEQDDWSSWQRATPRLSEIQLVGDDLFATNPDRIRRGVETGVGNAALIKLNQNGTLSGTLAAMRSAWDGGFATIVSARSGETEDSYIADLAVGAGAGQIKIGSVRNSERLSKYNQLLRIEQEASPAFAGMTGCAVRGVRTGADPSLAA